MAVVTVQVDQGKLKRVERLLAGVPRGMPRVMSRAINKVATKARTKIVRTIAGEIAVKSGELKRRNVTLRKASYSRWEALIRVSGRRIPLMKFGAKQTRAGVSYRIQKRGGRKTLRSAFIATMPSGHEGVFMRRAGARRLPIDEKRGPSVPAVMENIREMAAGVLDRAIAADLAKEIDVQTGLVLARG